MFLLSKRIHGFAIKTRVLFPHQCSKFFIHSQALLRVHVSQAVWRFLLWMYTPQVSLELATNNKIVAAPSPWMLVGMQLEGVMWWLILSLPFPPIFHVIWRSWVYESQDGCSSSAKIILNYLAVIAIVLSQTLFFVSVTYQICTLFQPS